MKKSITIITGQTATGKTKLGLQLAQKYNGELINCDSRQVYRYLDIITGKDLTDHQFHLEQKVNNFDIGYYKMAKLLNGNYIPLWLYDIVNPKQYFSSYDYVRCVMNVIKRLLEENKTPIIVGGTYFYLRHLLYGVETENIPPDWKLRKELENKTVEELQLILKQLATRLARGSLGKGGLIDQSNRSEKNNPQRLIRKIEILKSGRDVINHVSTLSFQFNTFFQKLNVTLIGLRFKNKNNAKQAIEKRVKERLKNGAIDEVKNLLDRDYNENDPGMKTIGYKQIIQYLKDKLSEEETIQQWITKERQYSKRQYTFMKRDKNIVWTEV